MSVNIFPFFRSSYLSFVGDQSEFADPELFDLCQISQDQNLDCLPLPEEPDVKPLTEEPSFVFVTYGPDPDFSKSYFQV